MRFFTCLHTKQGIALSFIIVITDIMTSVGDKRYSTACWKPETVTEVLGRTVKVVTIGQTSGLAVILISIHPNERIHPLGAFFPPLQCGLAGL